VAENTQSMSVMQVALPEAGEAVEYRLSADVPVKFNFYVSEVLFSCDGNDLILTGDNGGAVILKEYQALALQEALPVFELNGGEQVPGDIYMFAFNDSALSVETAAGGEVEGAVEAVSPGNVLPDLIEDSSSALDSSLFQGGESGHGQIPLSGTPQTHLGLDASACSLTETYDSVNDTVQQIIDSPDFF